MVVIYRGFADGVHLDAAKVQRALAKAPALLYHNIRSAMADIAAEHSKRVKLRFKGWTYGKKPVPQIQLRDGQLRRSVSAPNFAGVGLDSLVMTLKVDPTPNNRRYAEIQETGGTIKAKGKRLTIPLRDILDKRGFARPEFRLRRGSYTNKKGKSRTAWMTAGGQRTFILKANGKTFVAVKRTNAVKGSTRMVDALYELRDSVRLEPRLRFGAEWKAMGEFQQASFNLALERTVAGLTGGT